MPIKYTILQIFIRNYTFYTKISTFLQKVYHLYISTSYFPPNPQSTKYPPTSYSGILLTIQSGILFVMMGI